MNFFNDYLEIILLVLMLSMILLIGLIIALFVRISSMKQKYNKMLNGTGVKDLEGVMIQIHEEIKQLKNRQDQHSDWIVALQNVTKKMKSRIGFLRYNAFDQRGNDLSFSLAIVDDDSNGVVLTGLHSREQTYVFAKPLDLGESSYTLTPEEKEAINLAAKKA